MKAKINEKIICIPPYLSTSWDQVSFLHSEKNDLTGKLSLIIHLIDGKMVSIIDLEPSLIDIAFSAHMQYLEKLEKAKAAINLPGNLSGNLSNMLNGGNDQAIAFPFRLGMSLGGNNPAEGMESVLQHNPSQANHPSLPPEVVDKIAQITRILTNGDVGAFPKPEPHCNCIHCQVSRAMHQISDSAKHNEETVTADDLNFRSWDITQIGEKLYAVSNPLDSREKYNVYLGDPVGCTCGTSHCEHIKAVLFS